MAFSIRNPEAEALAREIVKITGESLTASVTEALRLRRNQLVAQDEAAREELLKELMAIADHCASLPNTSNATEQEIFGWDENGLPT